VYAQAYKALILDLHNLRAIIALSLPLPLAVFQTHYFLTASTLLADENYSARKQDGMILLEFYVRCNVL
jgi:hypothetical protein